MSQPLERSCSSADRVLRDIIQQAAKELLIFAGSKANQMGTPFADDPARRCGAQAQEWGGILGRKNLGGVVRIWGCREVLRGKSEGLVTKLYCNANTRPS